MWGFKNISGVTGEILIANVNIQNKFMWKDAIYFRYSTHFLEILDRSIPYNYIRVKKGASFSISKFFFCFFNGDLYLLSKKIIYCIQKMLNIATFFGLYDHM